MMTKVHFYKLREEQENRALTTKLSTSTLTKLDRRSSILMLVMAIPRWSFRVQAIRTPKILSLDPQIIKTRTKARRYKAKVVNLLGSTLVVLKVTTDEEDIGPITMLCLTI